ncbi:MAG: UvrD-helicase domain-containing protein [bacterium]|nr:UvrD-helicase domain-containing protein [bacterium]
MIDIFDGLNSKQKQAVEQHNGPCVILAGAGSGKTRVLIHKVLNLIQNHQVAPSSIVMITFTNKAAREMKERIIKASGGTLQLGFVGTFHSFCALALRKDGVHIGIPHNFTIYDAQDQQQLIKSILKKQSETSISRQGKYSPLYFLSHISTAKNQLIKPDRYLEVFSHYRSAMIAEIYVQYQKELKKNDALDFDDLIMKVVELFRSSDQIREKYHDRYQYILVDEFQDTNYAQYILTKILSQGNNNITVVGDFSQSIYSWRGADIQNLNKFSEDFEDTKVVELEENYRSTQNILDMAYSVISENETHPILKLHTKNNQGEEIEYFEADNEEDEAMYIANKLQELATTEDFSHMAVLYRTNAQSRVIEEMFLHYSIPYMLVGGTRFYERKEVKDVLSYLRLLIHPEDTVALERIKKLGKRRFDTFRTSYDEIKDSVNDIPTAELMEKIFDATEYLGFYDPDIPEDYARLENIKELKSVAMTFPHLVDFLEQVALVESEYFEKEKLGSSQDGVRLMTLHQAKGLEFPYVFIAGLEEGILPHSRSIDDIHQLEEERRLFYVGITRAMQKLYITYAKRRFIFGRRNYAMKSRFISSGEEVEDGEWW